MIKEIIELCSKLFRSQMAMVRTNIPAQVVSYDASENTCSVVPCIVQVRTDDPDNLEPVQLPQVDDVPVKLQGSGKLLLSVAPQIGSYGELRVFDRDISRWLNDGGITTAGSTRMHHFSDAVFSPGLYPLATDGDNGKLQSPISTDRISLRTRDGVAQVSVLDDNTIEIVTTGNVTIQSKAIINSEADAAALASKVDNFFTQVDNVMRTVWVPVPNDGGAALKTAWTSGVTAPTTTASANLKVDS
jgi:hypothetical protein